MKTLPMSFDVLAVSRCRMKSSTADFWLSRFRWTDAPFFEGDDAKLAFDDALNMGVETTALGKQQLWLFSKARPSSRRVHLQTRRGRLLIDRVEEIPDVGPVDEVTP